MIPPHKFMNRLCISLKKILPCLGLSGFPGLNNTVRKNIFLCQLWAHRNIRTCKKKKKSSGVRYTHEGIHGQGMHGFKLIIIYAQTYVYTRIRLIYLGKDRDRYVLRIGFKIDGACAIYILIICTPSI